MLKVDNPVIQRNSITGGRVDKTGFRYCYGIQFVCTKGGSYDSPGISTEMIPTTLSAGRRNPVDQLGLVGPQDKTEQSVLPGSDTKEVYTLNNANIHKRMKSIQYIYE